MATPRATARDVLPKLQTVESSRTTLVASEVAQVEDLRSGGMMQRRPEQGYSPHYQVCLPYRGVFVWHVGVDDVVGDANQILFVTGGEAFGLSQTVPRIFGELIITPSLPTLLELMASPESTPRSHPLFVRRSSRAHPEVQQAGALLRRRAASGELERVAADDFVLQLLRASIQHPSVPQRASARTRRLVSRTKEFLDAHMSAPLQLSDIARAVGASPAYLTDVFRRTEGVPVRRYLLQLRLARALIELPHTDDLTALALQLGFSSHSHFTSAFRRSHGCTPSAFRRLSIASRRALAAASRSSSPSRTRATRD